jgi:hypothetical protein
MKNKQAFIYDSSITPLDGGVNDCIYTLDDVIDGISGQLPLGRSTECTRLGLALGLEVGLALGLELGL